MSDPFDPEELLVCPFDPVHKVARKRMQIHLVKCGKNHSTGKFFKCPFNAEHVLPNRSEFNAHISQCPNRCNIEVELMREGQSYKQKGKTAMPPQDWVPPPAEESWDDDNVKFEPKILEELLNEEPVVKKKSSSQVVVPPPPEKVRMPHSYPMSGLKTGATTVSTRGRGRGLLIRKTQQQETSVAPGKTNESTPLNKTSGHGRRSSPNKVIHQGTSPPGTTNHRGQAISHPGITTNYKGASLPSTNNYQGISPPSGTTNYRGISPASGTAANIEGVSFNGYLTRPQVSRQGSNLQQVPPSTTCKYQYGGNVPKSYQPTYTTTTSTTHVPPPPPGFNGATLLHGNVSLDGRQFTNEPVHESANFTGTPYLQGSASYNTGPSLISPGLGPSNYTGSSSVLPQGPANYTGTSSLPQRSANYKGMTSLPQGPANYTGASSLPQEAPPLYFPNYGRGVSFARGIGRGYNPQLNNVEVGMSSLSMHQKFIQGTATVNLSNSSGTESPPPLTKVQYKQEKEEESEQVKDEKSKKEKKLRKLKKKLREVEEIEMKQKNGTKLTPEQVTKLNRKSEILEKIKDEEEEEY